MANPVVIDGVDALRARVGEELGVSDWHEVTQAAVDAFADVTGDDQWIHVDVERAKATPFGGTIVHGYFTLALIPRFTPQIYTLEGVAFALNYGLDRLRFPAPLPVGSRVRMRAQVQAVEDVGGGATQLTMRNTLEREGGDKPVCVADALVRIFSA
jgi:acyl dehydratase